MDHKKTILFFHPDLGIGGAERLVIDAAVGLQNRGYRVVIFTSHCDPTHCFDEARDGTLDVRIRGDWLFPPSVVSRFSILCAILRQLHLIFWTYFTNELRELSPDAFIIDQLSAGLPWLRYLYPSIRILFYCHFPDLLLAQGRKQWWKRAYRIPFDLLEQWSMGFADAIAVNSNFTKNVVGRTFSQLVTDSTLEIVYPCVDTQKKSDLTAKDIVPPWPNVKLLLSINRFERKKNIGLAIEAFAKLGEKGRKGTRLVLAGGYDNRVRENVMYHDELVHLAEDLGMKTATTRTIVSALAVANDVEIVFLLSIPNTLKQMLLKTARMLIYTPSNEHFGVVPLEAMLAGLPVLAANNGGPLETIIDGKTGWLRNPDDVESWTAVISRNLHKMSAKDLSAMGTAGVQRVRTEFSDAKMAETLDSIIQRMASTKRKSLVSFNMFLVTIILIMLDVMYWLASQIQAIAPRLGRAPLPPLTLTQLSLVSWAVYIGLNAHMYR